MVLFMMRIVLVLDLACYLEHPIKDVCIGVDSHVTESCTNEAGEYTLYDMKERLYMIDVLFLSFHSFTRLIISLIISALLRLILSLNW